MLPQVHKACLCMSGSTLGFTITTPFTFILCNAEQLCQINSKIDDKGLVFFFFFNSEEEKKPASLYSLTSSGTLQTSSLGDGSCPSCYYPRSNPLPSFLTGKGLA